MRNVVVLPQPEGPSSVTNSPLADREIDIVDRGDAPEPPADAVNRYAWHDVAPTTSNLSAYSAGAA